MHAATRLSGRSTEAATRVAAVIPARYASTRLPGKPLADIGGRPMVEHVYRRAASASTVDLVIVATDDERVARAVMEFGGDTILSYRHYYVACIVLPPNLYSRSVKQSLKLYFFTSETLWSACEA